MGLAGVGSNSDTFGLICSASSADAGLLSRQRSRRIKLTPTSKPGVYKYIFNVKRTPNLSFLADALNANLKDIVSDNMDVLPLKQITRVENLTIAEATSSMCGGQRRYGCISRIQPSSCLANCQVTRLLLNPSASLNGIPLTVRAPASVPTVPVNSTAVSTFGDVAGLGEFRWSHTNAFVGLTPMPLVVSHQCL
jgi:hypothetical protein